MAETDWFVCGETDAEGRKPDTHIDIGKPTCCGVLCCGPGKRQCTPTLPNPLPITKHPHTHPTPSHPSPPHPLIQVTTNMTWA
ncbi:hypothetical protein Pcinc_025412 [Petrolisthes cinctipes]|uniref:Uncharacterized protein n=1 Tax=Petrolisthes cinctipes TaxID=88211 RepID=A0AAE1KD30_PETCI|nr:hypothetical protein Pcinc_025412 [Petrolisthes cinctipes]